MTDARATDPSAVEIRLAAIWEGKGKLDRALAGYERVLVDTPAHAHAHVRRLQILVDLERFDEAIEAARIAIAHCPAEATLHKNLVRAIRAGTGGLDAAFDEYDLRRADGRPVDFGAADILCCSVVRNEMARLPYWLEYYRRLGVDAFLIVDNGSSDGTLAYLLDQPDVRVWQSRRSFKAANFGSAWFEVLLQAYGIGHWCLTLDADELLYFPDVECRTLVDLCRDLDIAGKRALFALLLDMYSDRPIRDTVCAPGQPFEDVCPFFDREFFHRRYEHAGPFDNLPMVFGGVRERVFGPAGDYLLSKIPLLKYSMDAVLAGGQHWTSYPAADIADETGCVLHFKFTNTFPSYAHGEATRGEHAVNGFQYVEYARGLEQDPGLCLFDTAHSVRFGGSAQLERLGIMTRSHGPHVQDPDQQIPRIAAVVSNSARPFWSVMLTVFDRDQHLERALRSVLDQAPDAEAMQIEVVHDGGLPGAVRDRLAGLVRSVGGERVSFVGLPERLGHPHIFNRCVERARGEWIHLLHDDDWVEPGFYAALERGARSAPDVGMAFCRWQFVNGHDAARVSPWNERETAGVVENWMDRIAVACRLQMPAVVVRRAAYERVGGFQPAAGSAFDWDMWKRLAAVFPAWHEPAPLASFREHDGSESHHLLRSGQQVVDSRRTIELSRRYLPAAKADALSAAALDHLAGYALDLARRQLAAGDAQAAIANVREGLTCSRHDGVREALLVLMADATAAADRTPETAAP